MEITIEISMYPLHKNYEADIIDFITFLKNQKEIKVRVNETSTHLFGSYDAVFEALRIGIKEAFARHNKTVFALKVLGANLDGSARHLNE